MEPRAYSRAPVGTQFVLVTYAYQSGDVLTDSALPLRDVSIKLNSGSVAYGRTFGVGGRQSSVGIFLPYILGRANGTVFEQLQSVRRSGLGDARLRLTINLKGSPALTPKEFAVAKPQSVIGASLTLVIPSGQYDPARLVNLGSNRWAFKSEIGLSKPKGKWTLEAAVGAWVFSANSNFFGGSRREQKPITYLQGNVIYTIRPRMWISAGGTFFAGGRTTVNGVLNNDPQKNSRIGATFSLPIDTRQSLKFAWVKGVTTRIGGDINALAVGWQYTWF